MKGKLVINAINEISVRLNQNFERWLFSIAV